MHGRHRVLIVDDLGESAVLLCRRFAALGHDARLIAEPEELNGYEPSLALVAYARDEIALRLRERCPSLYITAVVDALPPITPAEYDHVIEKPLSRDRIRQLLWYAEVRRTIRAQEPDHSG